MTSSIWNKSIIQSKKKYQPAILGFKKKTRIEVMETDCAIILLLLSNLGVFLEAFACQLACDWIHSDIKSQCPINQNQENLKKNRFPPYLAHWRVLVWYKISHHIAWFYPIMICFNGLSKKKIYFWKFSRFWFSGTLTLNHTGITIRWTPPSKSAHCEVSTFKEETSNP